VDENAVVPLTARGAGADSARDVLSPLSTQQLGGSPPSLSSTIPGGFGAAPALPQGVLAVAALASATASPGPTSPDSLDAGLQLHALGGGLGLGFGPAALHKRVPSDAQQSAALNNSGASGLASGGSSLRSTPSTLQMAPPRSSGPPLAVLSAGGSDDEAPSGAERRGSSGVLVPGAQNVSTSNSSSNNSNGHYFHRQHQRHGSSGAGGSNGGAGSGGLPLSAVRRPSHDAQAAGVVLNASASSALKRRPSHPGVGVVHEHKDRDNGGHGHGHGQLDHSGPTWTGHARRPSVPRATLAEHRSFTISDNGHSRLGGVAEDPSPGSAGPQAPGLSTTPGLPVVRAFAPASPSTRHGALPSAPKRFSVPFASLVGHASSDF
jgi:hypothetical protein